MRTQHSSVVYLASPYSHEDPEIREKRFKSACLAASQLMSIGVVVYSPIAHSHYIAKYGKLPGNWDFWRAQCEAMLVRCDYLTVLRIKGWKESVGVQAEIKLAQELEMPMFQANKKSLAALTGELK